MENEINYNLELYGKSMFDVFIGKEFTFDGWNIIKECNLHYLDLGQNDNTDYYGNKECDICFEFVEICRDDSLFYLQLSNIYKYPTQYNKTNEEIKKDLINQISIAKGIMLHTSEIETTGKLKNITEDEFANIQIETYLELKKENKI